jgi:hypothetical protein
MRRWTYPVTWVYAYTAGLGSRWKALPAQPTSMLSLSWDIDLDTELYSQSAHFYIVPLDRDPGPNDLTPPLLIQGQIWETLISPLSCKFSWGSDVPVCVLGLGEWQPSFSGKPIFPTGSDGTWMLVNFCPVAQARFADLLLALHALALFSGWPSWVVLVGRAQYGASPGLWLRQICTCRGLVRDQYF